MPAIHLHGTHDGCIGIDVAHDAVPRVGRMMPARALATKRGRALRAPRKSTWGGVGIPIDARSEPVVPGGARCDIGAPEHTGIGEATRDLLAALVEPPVEPRAIPPEFDGLRIVRMLGRGGSSRVYLADEPALARQVAVKVLDASSRASSRAWQNEASVVRALRHPGVVALHRVGTVVGRPYLVYERVPGVSLAHARMPMPMRRAARIARDVASALVAVHAAGFVHGDVKPSNIMLTPDPLRANVETARLIDFGIAHREGQPPYLRAGTPRYMAPEVHAGAAATSRSDVWSFARVLLELLTGGLDVDALRGRRAPRVLIDAITRGLADSPSERPTMAALRDVLES